MINMTGKNILVTGASSGIGRATAILLSQLGARVALMARNQAELEKTRSLMSGEGHVLHSFDLTKTDEIPARVQNIKSELGTLHGLFHAAGAISITSVRTVKREQIDSVYAVSVYAGLMLAKAFHAKDAEGGSLVMMSSVQSQMPALGGVLYASSKAALDAAVKALALEFAKNKIRVNSIVAGPVETEMMKTRAEMMALPDANELVARKTPLGFAQPEEIAKAAAFLLSDASAWITGTHMVVDGGFLLGSSAKV